MRINPKDQGLSILEITIHYKEFPRAIIFINYDMIWFTF